MEASTVIVEVQVILLANPRDETRIPWFQTYPLKRRPTPTARMVIGLELDPVTDLEWVCHLLLAIRRTVPLLNHSALAALDEPHQQRHVFAFQGAHLFERLRGVQLGGQQVTESLLQPLQPLR